MASSIQEKQGEGQQFLQMDRPVFSAINGRDSIDTNAEFVAND